MAHPTPTVPGLVHVMSTYWTSDADFARDIGVHRASVHRWLNGQRALTEEHKLKILQAAKAKGLQLGEIAASLEVARCPCCNCALNGEIRAMLLEAGDAAA